MNGTRWEAGKQTDNTAPAKADACKPQPAQLTCTNSQCGRRRVPGCGLKAERSGSISQRRRSCCNSAEMVWLFRQQLDRHQSTPP